MVLGITWATLPAGTVRVMAGAAGSLMNGPIRICQICRAVAGTHNQRHGSQPTLDPWPQFRAEARGAHTSDVNCVQWHPTQAGLLASCGDDGAVRLWQFSRPDPH